MFIAAALRNIDGSFVIDDTPSADLASMTSDAYIALSTAVIAGVQHGN